MPHTQGLNNPMYNNLNIIYYKRLKKAMKDNILIT